MCLPTGCWWPLLSTTKRRGRVRRLWREVQFGHLCPQPQACHQWDLRCASLALTSPRQVLGFHLCRPCTASAQLAFPAIPENGQLPHQWGLLSNRFTGSWHCAAIAQVHTCTGSLAPGSAGFVSMQHALAKDLSARLGVNASRVQLRSVTPTALPSTRHLLAVSLFDAFQLCRPGYKSRVSHTEPSRVLPAAAGPSLTAHYAFSLLLVAQPHWAVLLGQLMIASRHLLHRQTLPCCYDVSCNLWCKGS